MTTTVYKLTDEHGQTHGGTQWGENVTHTAPGRGDLCGPGWIHAYSDPLLAVLLNPIHAGFEHPRLWECEADVGKDDHGCELGCTSLTTLRELPLPEVTTEQRVRFAILAAKQVCTDERWLAWAEGWLSGQDRSYEPPSRTATAERPERATTPIPLPGEWAQMCDLIDLVAELLPGTRRFLDFVRAYPQSVGNLANGKSSIQRAERAALRLQALKERVTGE